MAMLSPELLEYNDGTVARLVEEAGKDDTVLAELAEVVRAQNIDIIDINDTKNRAEQLRFIVGQLRAIYKNRTIATDYGTVFVMRTEDNDMIDILVRTFNGGQIILETKLQGTLDAPMTFCVTDDDKPDLYTQQWQRGGYVNEPVHEARRETYMRALLANLLWARGIHQLRSPAEREEGDASALDLLQTNRWQLYD